MRITPRVGEEFRHRNPSVYQENNAVFGIHYGGKTHFTVKKIVLPYIKAGVKLWFWNHHAKFLEDFDDSQICYYLDELKNTTQIYIPEAKSVKHFNEFCELVGEQNNLHVVLDELPNYCTPQSWKAPALQQIIMDLPANQNVTYTAIFQKSSKVQELVYANAKHKFLFKYAPRNQDNYVQIMGDKASLLLEKHQRDYFKEEPNCKPYSFLYQDDERSFETEFYDGGKFREVLS